VEVLLQDECRSCNVAGENRGTGRVRAMLRGEGKEAPTAGRPRGAAAAAAAGGRTEGTRRRAGSEPEEQTQSRWREPIVGSDFCARIVCVCVCAGGRGRFARVVTPATSRAKIPTRAQKGTEGQTEGDRDAGRGAGGSGRKERLKDETEKDGTRRRELEGEREGERERRREKERDEERSKASVQRQCATSNHRLSFPLHHTSTRPTTTVTRRSSITDFSFSLARPSHPPVPPSAPCSMIMYSTDTHERHATCTPEQSEQGERREREEDGKATMRKEE